MTTGLKTPVPVDCATGWLLLIIGHSAHWQQYQCALLIFILFPIAMSFSTTISHAGHSYVLLQRVGEKRVGWGIFVHMKI